MKTAGVSVRIAGGLGNQMFQYAAARALALRLGVPLTLDLGFYDRRRHRIYGLDALPLAPHQLRGRPGTAGWQRIWVDLRRRLQGRQTQVYREPHVTVDPAFFTLQAPVHVEGHFQSARYFESAADAIATELCPPLPDDVLSRHIARAMDAGPAAALHVRRGDYLSNPKNQSLFAVCDEAYFQAALERLPPDCTVFVFSDDMVWARARLPSTRRLEFVDDGYPRDPLADLWLMARARHHVIANSSLSWWGAWLAKRGEGQDPTRGLTIAPARWFVAPGWDDRDIVPPGWLRL